MHARTLQLNINTASERSSARNRAQLFTETTPGAKCAATVHLYNAVHVLNAVQLMNIVL